MTTPSKSTTETSAGEAEEFEVMLVSDDAEPGYSVIVPALPGCFSQGDDWDEALSMAAEAIEGFLEFSSRPQKQVYDKERIIRDWTAIGCQVEVAAVWVQR